MHEELRDPTSMLNGGPGCTPRPIRSGPTASSVSTTTVCLRFSGTPDGRVGVLLARADQVEAWPRATMGGFEFIEATPSCDLVARPGQSRELLATPNIGSAVLFLPGDRVIGRLVPTEGGRMFESRPLGVPAGALRRKWPRSRPGGASSCGPPVRAGVRGLLGTTHARVSPW